MQGQGGVLLRRADWWGQRSRGSSLSDLALALATMARDRGGAGRVVSRAVSRRRWDGMGRAESRTASVRRWALVTLRLLSAGYWVLECSVAGETWSTARRSAERRSVARMWAGRESWMERLGPWGGFIQEASKLARADGPLNSC